MEMNSNVNQSESQPSSSLGGRNLMETQANNSVLPLFKEITSASIGESSDQIYAPKRIVDSLPKLRNTEEFDKIGPYVNEEVFRTPGIEYFMAQLENTNNYKGLVMYYPNTINFYVGYYGEARPVLRAYGRQNLQDDVAYGVKAGKDLVNMANCWYSVAALHNQDFPPQYDQMNQRVFGTLANPNDHPPVMYYVVTNQVQRSNFYTETSLADMFKGINQLNTFPKDLTDMTRFTVASVNTQFVSRVLQFLMTRNPQSPRKMSIVTQTMKIALYMLQTVADDVCRFEANSHTEGQILPNTNQVPVMINRNVWISWCSYNQWYKIVQGQLHLAQNWFYIPVTRNELMDQRYVLAHTLAYAPYPVVNHYTKLHKVLANPVLNNDNDYEEVVYPYLHVSLYNNQIIEGHTRICFVVVEENVVEDPDDLDFPGFLVVYNRGGVRHETYIPNIENGVGNFEQVNFSHYVEYVIENAGLLFSYLNDWLNYKNLKIPESVFDFIITQTTTLQTSYGCTNGMLWSRERWPTNIYGLVYTDHRRTADYCGALETPDSIQLFYEFFGVVKMNIYDGYSFSAIRQVTELTKYKQYCVGFQMSEFLRRNVYTYQHIHCLDLTMAKQRDMYIKALYKKNFPLNDQIIITKEGVSLNLYQFGAVGEADDRFYTACVYADHLDWYENRATERNSMGEFVRTRKPDWDKLKRLGIRTYYNQQDSIIEVPNETKIQNQVTKEMIKYFVNYYPRASELRMTGQAIGMAQQLVTICYPIFFLSPFTSVNSHNALYCNVSFMPAPLYPNLTLNDFMINTIMPDKRILGYRVFISETVTTFPRVIFVKNEDQKKLLNDMPQEELDFQIDI